MFDESRGSFDAFLLLVVRDPKIALSTSGSNCSELARQASEVTGVVGAIGGDEDPVLEQHQFEIRRREVVAIDILAGRPRRPLIPLIPMECLVHEHGDELGSPGLAAEFTFLGDQHERFRPSDVGEEVERRSGGQPARVGQFADRHDLVAVDVHAPDWNA